MKTFKQFLEESRFTDLAAIGSLVAGTAMAAPPKPEAVDRIVDYMKAREGFRAKAEPDKSATGNPLVIGYGTTTKYSDTGKPIKPGDTISREKGEQQIRSYIGGMTPQLEKIPGWDDMDAGKQAALISFGYNAGGAFYRPDAKPDQKFYSISQALKDKKWDQVPTELMRYTKAGGKELRGLVIRRKEEGEMWSSQPEEKKEQTPVQTQTAQTTTNTTHKVAKGDTLGAIAKKYGKSVEEIQKLNPEIKNPDRIVLGQQIKTK